MPIQFSCPGCQSTLQVDSALAGQQATKGVFITTSNFRDTAIEYAKTVIQKVILIDGDRLGELMIEYNIGVSRSDEFVLKKIDTDYFEDV